ncbi:MAG TPA: chloride channel protein [Candidatus Bathyarchaeia archaeon]|nr:chloride channel protein [Candidatus Bathyarchaeia archaeon]
MGTPKTRLEKAHRGVDQLGDFTTVDRRLFLISVLATIVGVVSALVAVALIFLIGFFTNLFYYGRLSTSFVSPASNSLGAYAIVIPAFGGLIIGVMARYGSERIRGHGIPEALEAILINRSKIEPKVTVLKPVSTAISIGSGGPFGAEGPIIMTGGAFGSVFAQILRLSSMERKTLLVAGAAGGMAATFNSPVAAVLLAVELLLFEWKPRSLIPVAISSITATVLRGIILGSAPLFPIAATQIPTLVTILSAAVVGIIAGGASTLLTWSVYGAEDAFRKLPIHWIWWPAIGGLAVGIGGLVAPRALGVGYDTINSLLLGQIALSVVAILVIVKALIWSFALGSGTSGGVLAPLMIMGGSLGMLESSFLPGGSPPLWVLVSLGAIIGGTMRSPFTGVVFSLELTRDVNALLPLLAGAIVADFVTVFSMKRSILTEKVARRGVHVAREYSVDTLELISVGSVIHRDIDPVPANMPMPELVDNFNRSEGKVFGYPVVDAIGHLQGMVTRTDLLTYMSRGHSENLAVRDIAHMGAPVTFSDEPVRVAADRMAENEIDVMAVVDPVDRQKVIGLISREDLFRARILWFEEEKQRERVLSVSSKEISRTLGRIRDQFRRKKKT